MKAVLCKSLDGPDALTLDDLPDPCADAGEVVIAVSAVSLNFFDTLVTRGKYQIRPSLPFSPGGEVTGRVLETGAGVEAIKVGERVLAYVRMNGCREKIVANAVNVVPLPENVSDEMAASLPIAYGTALHGLADRGRLKAGETLVVLGATGGTGLAAVEIGKAMGAHVIAAGTSDEKLRICAERGADSLLNLTTGNLKENIQQLTGGAGADVIYDALGGPYAEPSVRAMAWGGRYLVIGFAAGDIPKIPLNLLLLKGCELVGVFWGRHVEQDEGVFQEQMARLVTWCAEGKIRPHIDHVFPLEKTAEALRLMDARQIKGKIIIKP